MKIRSDFVTNSSSSSFIIAYKPLPEIDEATVKKYPFLANYHHLIESILFLEGEDTTKGDVFKTKEEYDKDFEYNYCLKDETIESTIEDDEYLAKKYNLAIEYLSKGFYILSKYVDTHTDYFNDLMSELAQDADNFVILEEGGQ